MALNGVKSNLGGIVFRNPGEHKGRKERDAPYPGPESREAKVPVSILHVERFRELFPH